MNIRKLGMSAICMALILFPASSLHSLSLTETIYMLPENEIELKCREFIAHNKKNKEHISIGFPILADVALWMGFDYVHDTLLKTGNNDIGDTFFKIKYYAGDFLNNKIHAVFLVDFRLPTGKNAYYDDKWHNLAFGNNEIKLGPVLQFDVFSNIYIHYNIFYLLREGENENFFGGFHLNIFQKESWQKIFGLNPYEENTFLERSRLINDYIVSSLALNSDKIYPVIPFLEIYGLKRIYRKRNRTKDLRIKAAGIDPLLLLAAGVWYFFNEATYAGAYVNYTLYGGEGFPKSVVGFEAAVQF